MRILLLAFIMLPTVIYAQLTNGHEFGNPGYDEIELSHYKNDSTANALVLHEEGQNYFEIIDGYVRLITKNYFKIKIFNKNSFDQANIKIPLYIGNSDEKLSNLRAITHNGGVKTFLQKQHIYTENVNENWDQVTFTFPNLQENCIIEYEYTITSPYLFNLTGWSFQSNIPKLYTVFTAKIPGNYKYNRKLNGGLNLHINDAKIEKKCFYLPNTSKSAECEFLQYAMKDVPAFKDEPHMLSEKNYISKIKFELSEYTNFQGQKFDYSKTWKDVDKEFKSNKNIGRQITKTSFFKNNIPENLLTETNSLKKAEQIYSFIQEHFMWNENYGVFKNSKVKTAFENKTGNASEINLSLVSALNSAGLSAHFVLLSTRDNGLPTLDYPVITDFNYLIAQVEINGKKMLLDATNKNMPFGLLPSRCLNYFGRVMDFDRGSYWTDIVASKKNVSNSISEIIINNQGEISGIINNTNTGYYALQKLSDINQSTKESYLEQIKNTKNNLNIINYTSLVNIKKENTITENITFNIESDNDDYLVIHPFLINAFYENILNSKSRNFPVDFTYSGKQIFKSSITIPENYKLVDGLQNQTFQLEKNAGHVSFIYQQKNNKVDVLLRFSLNTHIFETNSYADLMLFLNKFIILQKESPLIFKKV